jgi:hypothetical protein
MPWRPRQRGGVIALKDLTVRLLKDEPTELNALLRPPLFVPETLPAYEALDRSREFGTRIALVVDEFGVVVGLLTATDLLEVVAGEPRAGRDATPAGAARRTDGSWVLMDSCRCTRHPSRSDFHPTLKSGTGPDAPRRSNGKNWAHSRGWRSVRMAGPMV